MSPTWTIINFGFQRQSQGHNKSEAPLSTDDNNYIDDVIHIINININYNDVEMLIQGVYICLYVHKYIIHMIQDYLGY